MSTTTTTSTFGSRLRAAREAAGITRDRAARRLELDFGITTSIETLRRYETDQTPPEVVDILLVLGLADIYRVKASTLSPVIAKRAKRARDLLVLQTGCITDQPAFSAAA